MSVAVLVTGAGSGIGRAIAERFVRDGHEVIGVDVSAAGLAGTAAAAGSMHTVECDIRDERAVIELFAELDRSGRAVSVLINNAGIGTAATIVATTVEQWQSMFDVNCLGMFLMCRAALARMLPAGAGVIVNVSSVAGLVGLRERAAYCASKSAVIGLTRAIAVDHASDGIRCNAIAPGTVDTPWVDRILSDKPDKEQARRDMERRQLTGRMGTAQEVAAGVAFLASPEASYMNGSVLIMDGGMTAV